MDSIPQDYKLPDSIEEIEAGRKPTLKQLDLFDDSLMARLRQIKALEREETRR